MTLTVRHWNYRMTINKIGLKERGKMGYNNRELNEGDYSAVAGDHGIRRIHGAAGIT